MLLRKDTRSFNLFEVLLINHPILKVFHLIKRKMHKTSKEFSFERILHYVVYMLFDTCTMNMHLIKMSFDLLISTQQYQLAFERPSFNKNIEKWFLLVPPLAKLKLRIYTDIKGTLPWKLEPAIPHSFRIFLV